MKRMTFSTWLAVFMLVFFSVAVLMAMDFPAKARFMPLIVGIPGIVLCLIQIALDLFRAPKEAVRIPAPAGQGYGPDADLPEFGPHTIREELRMLAYFVAFIAGILLFGFYISVPIMLVTFLRREADAKWVFSLGAAAITTLVLYLMFGMLLRIELHPGFLTPELLQMVGVSTE